MKISYTEYKTESKEMKNKINLIWTIMKECSRKLLANRMKLRMWIKNKKKYKTELIMLTIFKPTSKISSINFIKEPHPRIDFKD